MSNVLNKYYSGVGHEAGLRASVAYLFDSSIGPSGAYRPITSDDYAGGGGGGTSEVTAFPNAGDSVSGFNAGGTETGIGQVFSAHFRNQLFIQNVGIQPIYLALATSATPSNYNMILSPGAASGDGQGGSWIVDNWYGAISVSGSGIAYTAFEY